GGAVAQPFNHRSCGFIAGGFDTQHQCSDVARQYEPCTFVRSGVSLFGSIERSTWEVRLMAILVTRPLPDGETTASALRAKGFDVLLAPMLRFEPVAFPDDSDAPYGAGIGISVKPLRAVE